MSPRPPGPVEFWCESVVMAEFHGYPLYRHVGYPRRIASSKNHDGEIGGFVRHANADRLLRDLGAVVGDMDELIGANAGNANAAIGAARERIAISLERARDALAKGRQSVIDEARDAAKSVDSYVHENVWQVIGVAGCLGLLVGMLLTFSQSSRSRRD